MRLALIQGRAIISGSGARKDKKASGPNKLIIKSIFASQS
jgi:hypothetical protein